MGHVHCKPTGSHKWDFYSIVWGIKGLDKVEQKCIIGLSRSPHIAALDNTL
jgi:hypothetical protein